MIGIIEKIALRIASQERWYDLVKLIRRSESHAIMLFFIVGERRIGKTLFFQRLACELFLETGKQTMWVRNKKVELIEDGFTSGYLTACKLRGWCPQEWICKQDGVWTDNSKEAQQVILFQSISTFSNRRGNETPDVMMIVFDEFMPEDRKYPPSPAKGLMSITKTVLSGREDARCFCLSNFISSANPYFVGFRIYPGNDPITVFPDKGIAIEICKGYKRAIEKDNPWNAVYAAGGYQDYATADEDKLIQLVRKPPKGANPINYLILSDGVLYRPLEKAGTVYYEEFKGKVAQQVIYTPTLQEAGKDIYLVPEFMKRDIKKMTEANAVRFSNPNVMFAILSMVYDAV